MKVVPHIKRSTRTKDEIKIITASQTAIEELLLENLLDHYHEYFNIDNNDNSGVCLMNWDTDSGLLTYAVMPTEYCSRGYSLNFDYVRKKLGITTKSLFAVNRFRVVHLDDVDKTAFLLPPG